MSDILEVGIHASIYLDLEDTLDRPELCAINIVAKRTDLQDSASSIFLSVSDPIAAEACKLVQRDGLSPTTAILW